MATGGGSEHKVFARQSGSQIVGCVLVWSGDTCPLRPFIPIPEPCKLAGRVNTASHSPGNTASHRAGAGLGAGTGHEVSHSKPSDVSLILETSSSVTPNLPEGPEVPLSVTVSPGLRFNMPSKAPLAEFKSGLALEVSGHVFCQKEEPPIPERLIYSPCDGILRAKRSRQNGVKSGMRKGSQQRLWSAGAGDFDRGPIRLCLQ